jgi:hypothetical protein
LAAASELLRNWQLGVHSPSAGEPAELIPPQCDLLIGSYDNAIWPMRGFPGAPRVVEHLAKLGTGLGGDHGVGVPSRQTTLAGHDTAMPIGGAVSGRSQTFADSTSKCLPRLGHRAARPQRPDDLDGLLEHLVAQPGKWPLPADNVSLRLSPAPRPRVNRPSDNSCMVAAFCATTAG